MTDCITLTYEGCTAKILLRGAEIASFKGRDGREIIWQADPKVWGSHAPVLFPVCGSLEGNRTTIDGVPYDIRKHGFVRDKVFTVAKLGDDFVELTYAATDETRAQYPFDFVLHVTYTLVSGGYTTTFLVENRSQAVMPFCIGGHPGFVCPMAEGAAFTDYQLVFGEMEEGRNYLAPGGGLIDGYEYLPGFRDAQVLPLDHTLFDDHDALIFAGLRSRSVDLVHKDTGKGIHFVFPKMEVLAVWTMPGANADYLCLEPWHGMPGVNGESGRMEDKPYVTLLAPGRCYKTWFTATVIE